MCVKQLFPQYAEAEVVGYFRPWHGTSSSFSFKLLKNDIAISKLLPLCETHKFSLKEIQPSPFVSTWVPVFSWPFTSVWLSNMSAWCVCSELSSWCRFPLAARDLLAVAYLAMRSWAHFAWQAYVWSKRSPSSMLIYVHAINLLSGLRADLIRSKSRPSLSDSYIESVTPCVY